jgi:hypothetical protein
LADGTDALVPAMHRLLILMSVLVIGGALVARWWLALRPLAQAIDQPPADAVAASRRGDELLQDALAQWQRDDPRGAAARNAQLRFGMAAPPLSLLIAIFAAAVGKVPLLIAVAIPLAATALAVVVGISGLPRELDAVARHIAGQPAAHRDDAGARFALAHAWNRAFPAALRWLLARLRAV